MKPLAITFLAALMFLSFQAIGEEPSRQAIQLSGNMVLGSSPAVAEIDGDVSNGKEIAVAGADGYLYVYHADGTLHWSVSLPNRRCTAAKNIDKAFSSPAVSDLFGDGVMYVVVGYGGFRAQTVCGGGVVAYRGTDGRRRWHFDTKRYSKQQKFYAKMHAVYSSPAIADVDGTGKKVIGFGSFDRNVYLLNANGSVRWRYVAADTVWSSPTFADVNGDGKLEMVIGTDISQNLVMQPPTANGGYVYALKTGASSRKAYWFRDPRIFAWARTFNQVIFSSPSVGDVVPSSPGPEVVVQSGCFFPQGASPKTGAWIKVLRGTDGRVLRTLPIHACSSSQPALADIDGDGLIEIVASVSGTKASGGDGKGRVVAYKAVNSQLMWEVIPFNKGRNDERMGDLRSPVIADLDGNGSLEIVVSNGMGLSILSPIDGHSLSCTDKYCTDGKPAFVTTNSLRNTPAVADLNDDGQLEIVAAAGNSVHHGELNIWRDLVPAIASEPAPEATPFATPWPQFRRDATHRAWLE